MTPNANPASEPLLAIAMIVRNESANLMACLDSCHELADEIVIIDGGSEDDTIELARRYPKVRVIEHRQWRGFGHQRNIAQTHVKARWVLWLDADERITPELAQNIREVIKSQPGGSAVALPDTLYQVNRLSWVFGRFIRHSGWHPDWVIRLYPTALTRYSDDTVHEHVLIPPGAKVAKLQGNLLHFTYRDLQHYLVKSAQYAHLWAEQRQVRGKRASLSQGVMHALGCFVKMYIVKAGFLDGRQGLLLALLSAHSTFAKYADLWIRHQTDAEDDQPDKPSNKPHP